jgi:hypothetical protein
MLRTAAALILLAGQAGAGAWTRQQGDVFLSLGGGWYSDGGYEESTAALYGEAGVLDWLTAGGALEGAFPSDGSDADLSYAAFLRARLWTGPNGDPFSVQVGWIGSSDDVIDTGPPQFDREDELDVRALYGRGFDSRFGVGWLNVEAGLRHRTGLSADEFRLDLTAGLRPHPDWLVMLQSFNTIGLRNNEPFGGDYDAYKLAPSIGYVLNERTTFVVGVEREIAGRNIDFGTRVRASLWLEF